MSTRFRTFVQFNEKFWLRKVALFSSATTVLLSDCKAFKNHDLLPFKQGVRGSNPRRGTKKEETAKGCLFFFGVAAAPRIDQIHREGTPIPSRTHPMRTWAPANRHNPPRVTRRFRRVRGSNPRSFYFSALSIIVATSSRVIKSCGLVPSVTFASVSLSHAAFAHALTGFLPCSARYCSMNCFQVS